MPAPILGDAYLIHDPNTTTETPTKSETDILALLDPAFVTAWNNSKYACPTAFQGDPNFIGFIATVAGRYKSGTGTLTPAITSINPTTAVHGVAANIVVTGTNFDALATVNFNGVDVPTTSQGPTQVTGAVPASLIPSAGTYPVIVRNSNGAVSGSSTFTAT
jgi:hypothetical protein